MRCPFPAGMGRLCSLEDLVALPDISDVAVVGELVGLQPPVHDRPRREHAQVVRAVQLAEVLGEQAVVGEEKPGVGPLIPGVEAVLSEDNARVGQLEVDHDRLRVVGGVHREAHPGLAPHEAEWGHIRVLRAGDHAVAVVDDDPGRIAQPVDEDHVIRQPEVVVTLDAADLGVLQQIHRAGPGQLGVGADAVVAVAPAVPGGVVPHPVELIAAHGRLVGLDADAVEAHAGARALVVGRALAVVVLDDHLGVGRAGDVVGDAERERGDDDQVLGIHDVLRDSCDPSDPPIALASVKLGSIRVSTIVKERIILP